MAEREVKVRITGDSSRLAKSFRDAEKSGQSFGKRVLSGVGSGLKVFAKAAGIASAAIGVGLVVALRHGTKGLKEQSKVMAQTESALKSTGNAAKTSAADIRTLTESLERKTGIDADQIQVGSNLILTFKNIRNEVGKNNDIFDQAQKTALDMSVAFGSTVKASALQLGKALDDPIRGVAALRRVGISFSKDQQGVIKSLVESGDILKAQKMILGEIEKQVGGSAEAYGKTLPGGIERAKRAIEKLTEAFAGPVLEVGVEALEGLLVLFQDERVVAAIQAFGEGLRDALRIGITTAKDFIKEIREIEGFRGRLEFVLDIGKDAAKKLAVRIGKELAALDWGKVGEKIGPAFSRSLEIPREAVVRVLDLFNQYVVENTDKIANAGAVIAAKIVSRLLDPAFWVQNWKEALTIALAVVPVAKVGVIGLALVRALLKPFLAIARPLTQPILVAFNTLLVRAAPVVARIGAAIIGGIVTSLTRGANTIRRIVDDYIAPFEAFSGSVGRLLESGLRNVASIVSRVGFQATGLLVRALSEGTAPIVSAALTLATKAVDAIRLVFGRLPRVLLVLLRLGIANTIVNFIAEAVEKGRQLGNDIIDGVVGGINNAAARVTDALVKAVGDPIKVAKAILGIRSPSSVTRKEIGEPLADGIIAGIIARRPAMVDALKKALKQTLNIAVQDARSNLASLGAGLAGMLGEIFGRTSAAAQRLSALTQAREERDAARRRQQLDDAIAQIDERGDAERRLQESLLDADERYADDRRSIDDELRADLTSARSRQARIDAQAKADRALADLERRRSDAQLDARAEYNRRLEELDRERVQAEQDLADFLEEQEIRSLERSIQNQKDAYETDLANLIEKFNTGAINAQQFRDELDNIVGAASGGELGEAFAGAFSRQLIALVSQLKQLIGFPEGIAGPGVVSPSASTFEQQLEQWRNRKQQLERAQADAKKNLDKITADAKKKSSPGGVTITTAEQNAINQARDRFGKAKNAVDQHQKRRPKKLAMGGIIKRAIIAGEAGPEAVIPLSTVRGRDYLADALEDAQRAQVATPPYGQTIVINVTVSGNEFSAYEFARKLAPELKRQVAMSRSR